MPVADTVVAVAELRSSAGHGRLAERALPLAARIALAVIVMATLAVVAESTAGPSVLVPQSAFAFPGWEAGPLHALTTRVFLDPRTVGQVFTIVLAVMLVAYGIVLTGLRGFTMREIAIVVVALHVILFLGPPLQLTDAFNYLGYAHLGGLHHLNPYTHVMSDERLDPIFRFTSWHDLRSPYGELFTMLTYPLGLVGLATAYWVLKAVTVSLSLCFVWLVWLCARRLGRDPRLAVAFVAFNPVFLIYAVGGFHNDFFMLVPSMGAIALLLARREGAAGASLMIAIAVKFTAVLIGPFLLLAILRDRTPMARARGLRFVAGALVAFVPLLAASFILFGTSLPNLQQQSTLLTDFSVPNLVGLGFGVGGSSTVIKVCELAVVLIVILQLALRRDRWLEGAGWSTLALVLSLAWAVPWYIVWVLPLAALVRGASLRWASVLVTAYLMFGFVPVTTQYLNEHHVNPLNTPAGHASQLLQNRLAN
jgi:alpha-1,6-mannosyltransferase